MEAALLEKGILGIIIIGMAIAIKTLYSENQRNHREFTDRLLSLITSVTENQENIHSALDKVADGLALQDYLAQKINEINQARNSKDD